MRLLSATLGLALVAACSSPEPTPGRIFEAKSAAEEKKSDAKKDERPPAKLTPFARPKAPPPPPPEGAALIDGPPLYVQRCDDAHPCPLRMQPEGETHCRELVLGGRDAWRLPERAEVHRFKQVRDQLASLEGFHWTRTRYTEDRGQSWIVDPVTGTETTLQHRRKPFTIRCVQEP